LKKAQYLTKSTQSSSADTFKLEAPTSTVSGNALQISHISLDTIRNKRLSYR